MRASQQLRRATATEHKAAEEYLNASAILDGSLSETDFAEMMRAHFLVWSAVNAWWPAETSRDKAFLQRMTTELRRDLRIAGEKLPEIPQLKLAAESAATRYGALYVLRGSTLGGTLINRKLVACRHLSEIDTFHFHAACEELPGHEWPAFLRELDAEVTGQEAVNEAVAAAKRIFGLYLRKN